MNNNNRPPLVDPIPYRMAFAGGWIDQPFVSCHNPDPPGSIVVVGLKPTRRFMDRAGMATGTRRVARELWPEGFPNREPASLVHELYEAENRDKPEPSGSQDMIGLIYPGVNRLDFDYHYARGVFPKHIESNNDPEILQWLENVIHVVPVSPRPEGYNPLGRKNLDPVWIRRLGQSGRRCYTAIVQRDTAALGESMNECMKCWEAILPHTVRHPTLTADLLAILAEYQSRYPGAMYSGCGGGYLYVVSETTVPDSFQIAIRTATP